MLSLHLDTHCIGTKLCNVLSILNEFILQGALQNFVTEMILCIVYVWAYLRKEHAL